MFSSPFRSFTIEGRPPFGISYRLHRHFSYNSPLSTRLYVHVYLSGFTARPILYFSMFWISALSYLTHGIAQPDQ